MNDCYSNLNTYFIWLNNISRNKLMVAVDKFEDYYCNYVIRVRNTSCVTRPG